MDIAMEKIRVLDRSTADLIAAGEVVERPASVIKELVENCIDAGATAVTVEIKDGGTTYMRVTDNGCGMDRMDARTAFLRHATSKISSGEDLFHIETLGFRGEALAAISAVSHIELITKTSEDTEGTNIRLEGGNILYEDCIGCPDGTTMIVERLFYNTPARMKFQKKNTTEGAAVSSVMDKLAMISPQVAFTFIKDGKQELLTTGNGDLHAAIYAVYGKAVAADLLSLSGSGSGVMVSGYIGRPETGKPSRNYQTFFVNGRYIKSRMLTAALDDGCKSYFERDKHPFCVILIDIDCAMVDVNVHPTKMEVKFSNERELYSAVYFAVKNAYEHMNQLTKAQFLGAEKREETLPFDCALTGLQLKMEQKKMPMLDEIFESAATYPKVGSAFYNSRVSPDIYPKQELELHQSQAYSSSSTTSDTEMCLEMDLPKAQPDLLDTKESEQSVTIVGQLFDTYIIAQRGEEVIYIDKHAAQERLIYENIKSQKDNQGITQELLTPMVVTLSKEETAEIIENLDFLTSLGFSVEEFGTGTVMVRGIPLNTCNVDISELISEVATQLQKGKKDIQSQLYDKVMYSIACKAAVKGGQKNGNEELLFLTQKVLSMPDVRYCPHGRPVAVFLKKSAFEKQFRR